MASHWVLRGARLPLCEDALVLRGGLDLILNQESLVAVETLVDFRDLLSVKIDQLVLGVLQSIEHA